MTAPIALRVTRSPAEPDEIEAQLARLDHTAGAYFGCDSGIAGLHPQQATLLTDPALALRVFADGLLAEPLDANGSALLALPALAPFLQALGRGPGRSALAALRAFLAALPPCPEVRLLGALRFDAYRLAPAHGPASPDAPELGRLLFGPRHWQRAADGSWSRIDLAWPGLSDSAERFPTAPVAPATGAEPADDFPEGGYAQVVAQALEHLRTQPLVSLTLSQSFRRRVALAPAAAFANLRRVNPAPATFMLHLGGERLFGASPDLQLVVGGDRVATLPVCGTVARGSGPLAEAAALRELVNEEVDAASLAVCSDALRNDLAPWCVPGSLRLTDRRRPMSLATVVHTVDRIEGRMRPGVDAWDLIAATAAPVMVTGTPRAQALRSIEELEASPRGWYGGLVVSVAGNGDALAGTILRTAVLRGDVAEVRAGGDLLADSEPAREERESRHKAVSLWRAFGLDAGGPAPGDAPAAAATAPLPVTPVAPVALVTLGDAFAAALADVLAAAGAGPATGDAAATVLAGADLPACRDWIARHGRARLLALGDAAACVLEAAGAGLRHGAPEQGRQLAAASTAEAPVPATPFHAGRYGRLQLSADAALAGWQIWARDAQGRPLAWAEPLQRTVCLLWRPDSLLCDAHALALLRAALRFTAGGDT